MSGWRHALDRALGEPDPVEEPRVRINWTAFAALIAMSVVSCGGLLALVAKL